MFLIIFCSFEKLLSMNIKLTLLPCSSKILKIIIAGDEFLANQLKIQIPPNWNTFGKPVFTFLRDS